MNFLGQDVNERVSECLGHFFGLDHVLFDHGGNQSAGVMAEIVRRSLYDAEYTATNDFSSRAALNNLSQIGKSTIQLAIFDI